VSTKVPERRTKWDVKREASHEALVDSAMRRFHELGYAATRVEDIVAGTGYSSGAFYFHFPNKTECFWHVVERREQLRGDWSGLLDGLEPATTSLEEVLARVFAYFAEALDGLNGWILVMVDFHQQHRDDPVVQARLAEIYARWHGELDRFVGALQSAGWVAADRDPALLATQLFAAAEGMTAHASLYGAPAQDALIDMLVRILR
jgi:TetR/AcrR family transcriptional repressor of nem operon